MYQIEKRVNSLTFNPTEIETLNPLILEYQQKIGIELGSVKDLFSHLLRFAISAEIPEIKTPIEPVTIEPDPNSVILGEFDRVIMLTPNFEIALNDYNETNAISDEISLTEILITALQTAVIKPEPIEKTIEVEILPENAVVLGENDVYFTLSDNEREIVDVIASNRAKRFKKETQKVSELAHDLMFNDNTLRNLGGVYYTGI